VAPWETIPIPRRQPSGHPHVRRARPDVEGVIRLSDACQPQSHCSAGVGLAARCRRIDAHPLSSSMPSRGSWARFARSPPVTSRACIPAASQASASSIRETAAYGRCGMWPSRSGALPISSSEFRVPVHQSQFGEKVRRKIDHRRAGPSLAADRRFRLQDRPESIDDRPVPVRRGWFA